MKYLFLFGALIFAAAHAQAASFDCRKATAQDEKTICNNRALNDKDVKMATTYQLLKGLFAMGARGSMMDSQVLWLHSRHDCKSDVVCLNKRYDERLAALKKIYDGIDKPI